MFQQATNPSLSFQLLVIWRPTERERKKKEREIMRSYIIPSYYYIVAAGMGQSGHMRQCHNTDEICHLKVWYKSTLSEKQTNKLQYADPLSGCKCKNSWNVIMTFVSPGFDKLTAVAEYLPWWIDRITTSKLKVRLKWVLDVKVEMYRWLYNTTGPVLLRHDK